MPTNSTERGHHAKISDLEINDVLQIVWSKRLLVLGFCTAAVIFALLYLRIANYQYTAKLDVTPVESSGGSGLASQLGNLGGLAALAGINLPSSPGSGSFDLYIESLKSRAVADELASRPEVMHTIFSREWDATSQSWRPPKGLFPTVKRGLLSILNSHAFEWRQPDGARLQEYLDNKLMVAQSAKKRMVTISFSHRDPTFAARFLTILHQTVDNRVRQRTLQRANESIAYLERKLPTISNVEHQKAIAQALSDQEKLRMMASSTAAFAAEPFGEPRASGEPTEPRPAAVLVLAIFFGLVAGCGVALLRAMHR